MDWIKMHTDRHDHPDIQSVGFWGLQAFEEACLVVGQFDHDGHLPAKYATGAYLARRNMAASEFPDAAARMEKGLRKCIEVGLIEEADDGDYFIPGWGKRYAETSTERVRKHRANKGRTSANNETDETDETLHAVSETQETRGEEIREEKKRGEKINARKKRELSVEAQAIRQEIALLIRTDYPPASFDALEARLRDGDLTGDDALGMVRALASDSFWGGQVKLDPSTLFRPKHWPGLLAKSRAGPARNVDLPRGVTDADLAFLEAKYGGANG